MRFCGIVELEPRPATNGSAASPNSVADITHVERDLGQAAAEQGQQLHGFGDAVAGDVPGDRRVAEAELARQLGATPTTPSPWPSEAESAGGAAELGQEHPRAQLAEARSMTIERRQPDRRLVSEGDRQRMLQVGAAGHRRVAMAPGEVGEVAARGCEVGFDEVEAGADLQHHGGIHDVLGGGPPVQPAPGLPGALGELAHQGKDRIADGLGFALEAGEVERLGMFADRVRRRGDLRRRLGRNDPEPGLGAGEGGPTSAQRPRNAKSPNTARIAPVPNMPPNSAESSMPIAMRALPPCLAWRLYHARRNRAIRISGQ